MYPYSWKHDCFEVSKNEYNTICIICDEILQIMVRNIFDFFSPNKLITLNKILTICSWNPFRILLQECLKCITKRVDSFILFNLNLFSRML